MTDPGELYGLPLDRFVPERAALVKALRADGRREEAAKVGELRKPSVSAWAVNQLVRTQRAAVSELFAAGDALSSAQNELLAGRGDPRALREATVAERAAVDQLVVLARGLLTSTGAELTAQTVERVSDTLHAAALDEDARNAVKDGCLVRELRHVGLGAFGELAAPTPPRNRPEPKPEPDPEPDPEPEPPTNTPLEPRSLVLTDRLADDVAAVRPMRDADAEPYAAAFVDDSDLGRLVGFEQDPDPDSVRARMRRSAVGAEAGEGAQFAVTGPVSDAFWGVVALHSVDWRHRRAEVAFWLAPGERRRGVGTHAVALVVDWLFAEFGIERIELTTTPDNPAVPALAARLGFTQEGVLRARNLERGVRVDIVWFGLLRDEWRGI